MYSRNTTFSSYCLHYFKVRSYSYYTEVVLLTTAFSDEVSSWSRAKRRNQRVISQAPRPTAVTPYL
jgi:hypothetical protein